MTTSNWWAKRMRRGWGINRTMVVIKKKLDIQQRKDSLWQITLKSEHRTYWATSRVNEDYDRIYIYNNNINWKHNRPSLDITQTDWHVNTARKKYKIQTANSKQLKTENETEKSHMYEFLSVAASWKIYELDKGMNDNWQYILSKFISFINCRELFTKVEKFTH